MHKTWLIIRREYLSRVKKRSFIVITLLVPVLIAGFVALQAYIISGGSKEDQHVAVLDESGLFRDKLQDSENIHFTFLQGADPSVYRDHYADSGYTGYLYIPPIELSNPSGFTYYAKNQLGLSTYMFLTGQLNSAIESQRMINAGIDKDRLAGIKANVSLAQPGTGTGNTEYATVAATAAGYVAGFLIYFVLLFFGAQVMRGVAEEKTNRIAEVLVSSVKPFQMMIGKIVGIATVGLTQFLIWGVLVLVLFSTLGALFPGVAGHAADLQQAGQMGAGANSQVADAMGKLQLVLDTLPLTELLVCFVFYFLGGYLLYAALFAAVGSAVDQDMTESQALTLPITLPIILSFFLMFNAIQEPNSPLAVVTSIIPFSSPLVMIARIPFGVPWWQLALSITLLVLGFLFTTWLAAKIYRTGILIYGKKVTLKELGRWAFRKG